MAVDQIVLITEKRKPKGKALKPLFDFRQRQGFLNQPLRNTDIIEHVNNTSVLPKKPHYTPPHWVY